MTKDRVIGVKRRAGLLFLLAAVLLLAAGLGLWRIRSKPSREPLFLTAAVKRGDLIATISATGTVEPEQVVDVGAQVAGIIVSFGRDEQGRLIDYGSPVKEGTVLARIDDSLYAAALESAKAQLQQAEANKVSADANLLQMKANLFKARADWNRAQMLGPSDALSRSAYDQYQSAFDVAEASLAGAESGVVQSIAALQQAKANLISAQVNLSYCVIKSPVTGLILDRRVNMGQTVVPSLSAPSLFLIAKNLDRVKVWVSVNERDIGRIVPGQTVGLMADAYPNRVFEGQVAKVRLNAMMTQNVLTYTVEVNTDNPNGKLLPYLTVNARFSVGRRKGVLLVPNAALRWSPRPREIAPPFREKASASGPGGTIWIASERFVRPVSVQVGLTDGKMTQVEGTELTEGLPVVFGKRSS